MRRTLVDFTFFLFQLYFFMLVLSIFSVPGASPALLVLSLITVCCWAAWTTNEIEEHIMRPIGNFVRKILRR